MLNIYMEAIPPKEKNYNEYLRYLCQSLHPDTPDLPYLVSMWSYVLLNNGLTEKQAKTIHRYMGAVDQHLDNLNNGGKNGKRK